eukprot:6201273-Pleurochrysis_carterae.AAC.1
METRVPVQLFSTMLPSCSQSVCTDAVFRVAHFLNSQLHQPSARSALRLRSKTKRAGASESSTYVQDRGVARETKELNT